jgi:hypothetical protein
MDQKLIEALNSVRAKRGMDAVRSADKDTAHNQARRSVKPRSQKGRKYSAKQEAKRAAWRRSKGFMTRKEKLEELPDNLAAPEAAVGPPDGPVEDVVKPMSASTAGLGFTGSYFDLPRPTLPPELPRIDLTLTHAEAKARGYVVQIGSGMYQGVIRYKLSDGAPWIVCRPEGEAPKPVPSPRPSIADLYARSQPKRHSGCPDWNGVAGTHCNSPRCTGFCGGC